MRFVSIYVVCCGVKVEDVMIFLLIVELRVQLCRECKENIHRVTRKTEATEENQQQCIAVVNRYH